MTTVDRLSGDPWTTARLAGTPHAMWLNGRYKLRAADPNRYAGVAWAVVGKHNRPWLEHVFGQMHSMSLASTGRKLDAKRYIGDVGGMERSHA